MKSKKSICTGNKSSYRICPSVSDQFAATELQRYLKLATSADLPVVEKTTGPALYLISDRAPNLRDAFSIKVQGDDIIITGSNPRSVLYGVYAFLEQFCGIRFFAPDFECIPERDRLEIPADLRIEQTAEFAVRTLRAEWTMNVQLVDWAAKNRFNSFSLDMWRWDGSTDEVDAKGIIDAANLRGLTLEGSGHAMCYFLKSEKYYDPHPEWYPEVEGKRIPGKYTGDNFCYSNPEAVAECTRNVIASLRQLPAMKRLSIWPGDGGKRCGCERCRNKPFMVLYGNAVKHIRQHVHEELPEVEVFQEAYNFDNQERPLTVESTTRTLRVPPEHHDLPTLFAYWGQNLSIPLAENPDPGHRLFYEYLQEYCRRNPQLAYIFSMHTDTFMLSNLCPVFGPAMAADFREFKRLGIDQMFLLWITWNTESEQNMEWVGFQNGALWARMAADKHFDAAGYRQDYYRWVFGESQAEQGEQLWDRLNAALNPLQVLINRFPWNRSSDAWGLGWNRKVPQYRWQLTTDLGQMGTDRLRVFSEAVAVFDQLNREVEKLSDRNLMECRRFKKYVEHCSTRVKGLSLLFKAQEAMQTSRWAEAREYLQQALDSGMTDERDETIEWLQYTQKQINH
jgi:hypothetical protein